MLYRRKKKSGTTTKVELKNSQKRYSHKARHGLKNTGNGVSGSLSSTDIALMDIDQKKKVYAAGGLKNQYESIFDQVAKEQGVPKEILSALGYSESKWQRDTLGGSGEKGIMQLMPDVVSRYGVTDPFDPYENVTAGAKYLKEHYDKTGNWRDAIGYYNAGEGNWKNPKNLKNKGKEHYLTTRKAYYDNIYSAIDEYEGKNRTPLNIPMTRPAVADNTRTTVPGKDYLFPVQKTTLPSINKPLPKSNNTGIRTADQGYEQNSPDMGEMMKLYDNPDLAGDLSFVQNLFKSK